MTLAEEWELEVLRSRLTYIAGDHHSKDPHWHTKYRWLDFSANHGCSLGKVGGKRLRKSLRTE